MSGRHIDYVTTRADARIMQVRMLFVADELRRTKELLAQVQQNDESLRNLLAMNSKQAIISSASMGGPTPMQSHTLGLLLSGNLGRIDNAHINMQTLSITEKSRLLQNSYDTILQHISAERARYLATPIGWPAQGTLTSPFGMRVHPIYRNRSFHRGLDIANSLNTPVTATANGVVIFAGRRAGFGNVVVVEHGHNFRTLYAHLNRISVSMGERVTRGQRIGLMGATGTATGVHVHYEVHYRGQPINPMPFMRGFDFENRQQHVREHARANRGR